MESLLVAFILNVCAGDKSTYYVQGYAQDCHHYYINCVIGEGGEVSEKTLERCKNGKQKATRSVKLSK